MSAVLTVAEYVRRSTVCPGCGGGIDPDHPQVVDSGRERHGDHHGYVFHKGCLDVPRTFYKVIHHRDFCVWPTREEAEEDIENNAERFFEEDASDWTIEEVTMTWRKYFTLGEHEGW